MPAKKIHQWFWLKAADEVLDRATGPFETKTEAIQEAEWTLSAQLTMFNTPHVAYVGEAQVFAVPTSDRRKYLLTNLERFEF